MTNKKINTLKYLLVSTILSATINVVADGMHHTSMPKYDKYFKRHHHVMKKKQIQKEHTANRVKIRDVDLIVEHNDPQVQNNTLLQAYIRKILLHSMSVKQLEHYIMLINKIPGYEAQYNLRNPKPTQCKLTKSVELVLDVKRTKAKLVLDANNNGGKILGKYQFSTLGQIMNPFGWNDSIILNAATSDKPKKLLVVTGGYLKRLNSLGTSANVLVSYLKDNPLIGNPLNNTTLMYRGELEQYVILDHSSNVKLDLGIERHEVKHQNPTGKDIIQKYSNNLMYVGGRMQHTDSTNAESLLVASYHHTLNDVKFKIRGTDRAFDENFGYFKLSAHRDQPLFSKFSMFGQVTWQHSSNLLPIEHQFIVGGHIGRGYTTGLISANKGLDGLLELRYTHHTHNNNFLEIIQPYAFIEGMKLSSTHSTINKNKLYSAGGGIRAHTPWDISLDLEVAAPFTKKVLVDGVSVSNPVKFSFFISKVFKV